jgi:3-deoxy-D-manno-octulosonic-acid transferase
MIYNLLLLLGAFLKRRPWGGVPPSIHRPIWIHAVSVGEVKAARPLVERLQGPLLVTTTTETGLAEAKRLLKADAYARLPLDTSWNMRRWMKAIDPKALLLIESDLWPNLLRSTSAPIALLSGKMSERSFARFSLFPHLTRRLFSSIDLFCLQSEEMKNRFAPFVPFDKIHVTGNLKLDQEPEKGPLPSWLSSIGPAFTLSCTHEGEEKLLLEELLPRFPRHTFFVAPRHPHRFDAVAKLYPFTRFSEQKASRLILVDAIGQLSLCYRLSDAAILGGSFFPGVGGHNLFEPLLYGTPVFYGHHIQSQIDLAHRLGSLGQSVEEIGVLLEQADFVDLRKKALLASEKERGSIEKTLFHLLKILEP